MTIEFITIDAARDHSRAAAWRVYVNGLLFARVDTAAIARCIRANRAAA